MHNDSNEETSPGFAGADVSQDWVDVAYQRAGGTRSEGTRSEETRSKNGSFSERRFGNTPSGHQQLITWLRKKDRAGGTSVQGGTSVPGATPVQITIEASGIYSLDLALALHQASGIELMVAHPKALKDYRGARGRRAKTDRVDARLICDFCHRMPFEVWQPPSEEAFQLRALARRLLVLIDEKSREQGRLHAATVSRHASRYVVNDIEVNIRHLDRRIDRIEQTALSLIEEHAALKTACDHLRSVKGIGDRSAVKLLGELVMMPKDLTVRQWVAFAGLDVRHHESGTSVSKPGRISKQGNARLRKALYMPAQVAIQNEPNVHAFYQRLMDRGKKPMVAIVAVMRKLLHAIYGMLKHNQDFEGQKFYQMPASAA